MSNINHNAAAARAGEFGPDAQKRQQRIDKLARAELEAGRASSLPDAEGLVAARIDGIGGKIPRIFRRLFAHEKTTAEQIAKLQAQVAAERAQAVLLKRKHDAMTEQLAQLNRGLLVARSNHATATAKIAERQPRIASRVGSPHASVVEIGAVCAEIIAFERVASEALAFIAATERTIAEISAQLAAFEKAHGDDLILVEETAA